MAKEELVKTNFLLMQFHMQLFIVVDNSKVEAFMEKKVRESREVEDCKIH